MSSHTLVSAWTRRIQALTVAPNTATVGAAYSGSVSGRTSGSALALSGAGAAGLSLSGTTISGTPTTAGAVNVIETLNTATNSPRTSSGAITVGAAGAPALAALTVSPGNGTAGTAYSGTVTGKTSGSTLALTGAGSDGLSINGTTISGTPTTAGVVNIVETLNTASNSPRTTSGAVTIAAATVALQALTVSPNTATAGTAYSGTINGKTSGSALALTGAGADGMSISGTTLSGTPTTAGPINIVETLNTASNSPRTNTGVVTVAAGATALPKASFMTNRWSADQITGVADGGAVASWPDSIGGATATQTTAARQPVYRANRANGKPSVDFPGGKWMTLARAQSLVDAVANAKGAMMFVMRRVGDNQFGGLWGVDQFGGYWLECRTNRLGVSNGGPWVDLSGDFYTIVVNRGDNEKGVLVNGTRVAHLQGLGAYSGTDAINLGTARPTDDFNLNGEIMDVVVWAGTDFTNADALQAHKWACDRYAKPYPWAGINRFMVFGGDSITDNNNSTVGGWPQLVANQLGLGYGQWSQHGYQGGTPATIGPKLALHVDPIPGVIGKPLTMTWMEWANQRGGPDSGAQQANTQSLINDRIAANASIRIALMNSTALGGAASNGQGGDRNADGSTSVQGQGRIAYNNWVKNTATGVAARIDIAADANVGVIGAAPISSSAYPTTYFADDTHPSVGNAAPSGTHSIAAVVAAALPSLLA